jgi:magnesium transporter
MSLESSGGHCRIYEAGRFVREGRIADLGQGEIDHGDFVWVAIVSGHDTHLDAAASRLGFHSVVEAARNGSPGRLIDRDARLGMVLSDISDTDGKPIYGNMTIFLGRQFVVSVTGRPEGRREGDQIEANPGLLARGPAYFLSGLLAPVASDFLSVALALEARAAELERQASAGRLRREDLYDVLRFQHDLFDFKRGLAANLGVIEALTAERYDAIDPGARPYLRDVLETLQGSERLALASQRVIAGLMSLSTVPASEIERTVRTLSAWAVMFALLTSATALSSVNFPGIVGVSARFGYGIFLLAMGSLCAAIYLRLRRQRWV